MVLSGPDLLSSRGLHIIYWAEWYYASSDTGAGSFASDALFSNGTFEATDTAATGGMSADDVQLVKLLKLLRLVKLLRLARLQRLKKKYEDQFYDFFQRVKAFNNVIIIFCVAHWLCCVWYYVGSLDDDAWVVKWVAKRYAFATGTVADLDLVPLTERYLVNYYTAVGTLIAGSVPSDMYSGTLVELFFGLFAIVIGGFVYSNIIASITELTRKNSMEGDIALRREAEARAMCRTRADTYLTAKIMEQTKTHLEHFPALDVPEFLNSLTGDLEIEFAGQLGWVPCFKHGIVNYGMLHKVPFFSGLDVSRSSCYLPAHHPHHPDPYHLIDPVL